MEVWVKILSKLVASIISIVDSASLRDRLYDLKDEHEVMWTALDDISRMYKDHPSGHYAKNILENIKKKYGR